MSQNTAQAELMRHDQWSALKLMPRTNLAKSGHLALAQGRLTERGAGQALHLSDAMQQHSTVISTLRLSCSCSQAHASLHSEQLLKDLPGRQPVYALQSCIALLYAVHSQHLHRQAGQLESPAASHATYAPLRMLLLSAGHPSGCMVMRQNSRWEQCGLSHSVCRTMLMPLLIADAPEGQQGMTGQSASRLGKSCASGAVTNAQLHLCRLLPQGDCRTQAGQTSLQVGVLSMS